MPVDADSIGVIGVGCRVPRAEGPAAFWGLLCSGGDAISEVGPDRWPSPAGQHPLRWAGLLDDIDSFDSDFFRMSVREAEQIDPQQRIALEVVAEAFQDAGIPMDTLRRSKTGVFFGASSFDHGVHRLARGQEPDPYAAAGSALSILANRISYTFDLRGPSVVVDTACSSSLVAVNLARHALLTREVDLAVVGGVNLLLNPVLSAGFAEAGMLAPDGRCKTFDHRANGYVRSEGAGVVVLRRIEDSRSHGDRVYALVKGSGVNSDGRSNGLFAPNRPSQEALLRDVYARADMPMHAPQYVEAHGTGTALGDPIEIGALAATLGADRKKGEELRVGSVKSNIGHLEAGAGVVGLIKTALALHHEWLPQSIHFDEPNPLLRLDRVPIRVQDRGEPWPECGGRRIAGVSSFGFGGTNAHVIVTSAEPGGSSGAGAPLVPRTLVEAVVLPVSAPTHANLTETADDWAACIERGEDFFDTAATAAHRRDHFRVRAAVVAESGATACAALRALAAGQRHGALLGPVTAPQQHPQTVFAFGDRLADLEQSARTTGAESVAFTASVERCRAVFAEADKEGRNTQKGRIPSAITTARRVFMLVVALAETWRSRGVESAIVVGEGVAEFAGAYLEGLLGLGEAVALVDAMALGGQEGRSVPGADANPPTRERPSPANDGADHPIVRSSPAGSAKADADIRRELQERVSGPRCDASPRIDEIARAGPAIFVCAGEPAFPETLPEGVTAVHGADASPYFPVAEVYVRGGHPSWTIDRARPLVSLPPRRWNKRRFPRTAPGGPAVAGTDGTDPVGHPVEVLHQPGTTVLALRAASMITTLDKASGKHAVSAGSWLAAAIVGVRRSGRTCRRLVDITFAEPLSSGAEGSAQLAVVAGAHEATVTISSRTGAGPLREHLRCGVRSVERPVAPLASPPDPDHYGRLRPHRRGETAIIGEVSDPGGWALASVLDQCLRSALELVPAAAATDANPISIASVQIADVRDASGLSCRAQVTRQDRVESVADFQVLDGHGRCLVHAEGVRFPISGSQSDTQTALPKTADGERHRGKSTGEEGTAALIAETIAEAVGLRVDEVARDTVFSDLGIDSMMALKIRRRIEERLGAAVDVALIWEHPTVRTLATALCTGGTGTENVNEAAAISPSSAPRTFSADRVDPGLLSDADLLEELAAYAGGDRE